MLQVVVKVVLFLFPVAASAAEASRAAAESSPPARYDTCSGPIQEDLLYGISGLAPDGIPVAVDDDESLADTVCCDSRAKYYAEPQFLYRAPDVALFDALDGVTTFYDSACGLPLFRAPVNRTMADFEADTEEHGWPSFRSAEVVVENVLTDEATGLVSSTCGTHLGSYLPDAQGARWCIDLSCIAGHPVNDTLGVVSDDTTGEYHRVPLLHLVARRAAKLFEEKNNNNHA